MNDQLTRTLAAVSLCVFLLVGCIPVTPKPVTPPKFVSPTPVASDTPPPPTIWPTATVQPHPLEFVTTVGRGILQRVAVSPDGQTIAAASTTGLTLHDADTLDVLGAVVLPGTSISEMGWTDDGAMLIVGRLLPPGRGKLGVFVLDARNGRTLDTLMYEGGQPRLQDVSPDGTQVVIEDISREKWLLVDVATHEETVLIDPANPGDHVLWLPDGRLIAAQFDQTSTTYHLREWDSDRPLIEVSEISFLGGVTRFSSAGDRAAITLYGFDLPNDQVLPRVEMWNLETGEMLWRIDDLELNDLIWLDDDTLLGVRGSVLDQSVLRIDAATGTVLEEYSGGPLPGYGLGQLHPGPSGRFIGTTTGSLHVFNAQTYEVMAEAVGYNDDVWSGKFSPDGAWIMTTLGTSVRIWDSHTGVQHWQMDSVVGRGDWSSDSRRIALVDGMTGQVGVWTWVTGLGDFRFETGLFSPGAVLWLADDHLLVSGTSRLDQGLGGFVEEYALVVFDLESGEEIFWRDTETKVEAAAAAPDGEVFAYAELGTIVIANSETGLRSAALNTANDTARSLAWSPDGAHLAGAFAFQVAIWDRDGTRLVVADMPDIVGEVSGLGWSPDGRLLFGIGRHRTGPESYGLVWDSSTGDLLIPHVRLTDESMDGLTTSRDGRLLVDHNGRLEVWALAEHLP